MNIVVFIPDWSNHEEIKLIKHNNHINPIKIYENKI